MLSTGTVVRVIDQTGVDRKLLLAAPRILAQNRAMVTQMLEAVKAEIQPGTPLGPGHFGEHLRDSYKIEVASKGVTTIGSLSAPPQGYWREFGTKGRFRGRRNQRRAYAATIGALGTGGEKAGLFATRALTGVRRFLDFYYGAGQQWWRL